MLYSYVVGPKKDTIMNSTDLAVRRIDHDSGDSSFDVVARMSDDAGNVYIRSIGSLSENAVKAAYGFEAKPMLCKTDGVSVYAWTNSLALRPATLGRYDLCAESGKELQAMVIIPGRDHHIEINRKQLRSWEGDCGGFAILRLMPGDVALIDGNWLHFEFGLRKINKPGFRVEMTDFSSDFNFAKILAPSISIL